MCQTIRAIRSGAGKNRAGGCFQRHLAYQLLLELSVQSPGAVAGQGNGRLRPGPGECAEGGEDSFPVSRIGHDDAAGALMDHGLPGPGLSLQPGFQQIRLADRHAFLTSRRRIRPPGSRVRWLLSCKSPFMKKGAVFRAPFRSF